MDSRRRSSSQGPGTRRRSRKQSRPSKSLRRSSSVSRRSSASSSAVALNAGALGVRIGRFVKKHAAALGARIGRSLKKNAAALGARIGRSFRKKRILFMGGLGITLLLLMLLWNMSDGGAAKAKQLADIEAMLRRTGSWMQRRLDRIDKKIAQEVTGLKREVERMLDMQAFLPIKTNMMRLENQMDNLASSLTTFKGVAEVVHNERGTLQQLVEAVADGRALNGSGKALSLQDIKVATKHIVDDAIEEHVSDGVGRPDYALASGGGKVLGHSEAFPGKPAIPMMGAFKSLVNILHPKANRVIEPSFGEPGQCLPLMGSDVYVDIQLRRPIYPDSVTLQHVSKKVAYDVGSAPKDFEVWGWLLDSSSADTMIPTTALQLRDMVQSMENPPDDDAEFLLLGKFTYDVQDKGSVQTFVLWNGNVIINRVRLHVLSNHGSPTHTCLYRFRVHGTPPPQDREEPPPLPPPEAEEEYSGYTA